MQFDQDTIRELSVHAVQQFVSNGTPLDTSIAEKAKALRLSEEQVRRVVEATNVIAFLKLREQAEDKTFEFEVSSFDGVMSKILEPTAGTHVLKAGPDIEKVASTPFTIPLEIPDENLHAYLAGELYRIRGSLEKVAFENHYVRFDLEKAVQALVKQADWQERLSVVASQEDFDRIRTVLCAGSGMEKSASLRDLVFVGKELEVAKAVVDHIKQASVLSARQGELEAMEKKAFAALASMAARAAKVVVPKKPSGSRVAGAAGWTAGALGKGAFKAGKSVVNTVSKSKMGVLGAAGLATAPMMYKPKINPHTGLENDVWKTLYN